MVETRSNLKKENPNVTKKQSIKKKLTLGSKNSKAPFKTSSETVSESSPLLRLYTVLNYFSNYFQSLRGNLENTTISSNSIVTESTSPDSKENQIPEECNENVSSESSSYYTRWAWLIGSVIVIYTSYFIHSFCTSTQLDLDPKGDNNLPTGSSGKIQSIQDQKQVFDIKNYLMDLSKYFKNFPFDINQFIVCVGVSSIVGFISGYGLSWRQSNRSPSTAHNDNNPRHESPDDNNSPASYTSLAKSLSAYKMTTGDSSADSDTSFFREVGQGTNSNINPLAPEPVEVSL